jgi:hypothetical protein
MQRPDVSHGTNVTFGIARFHAILGNLSLLFFGFTQMLQKVFH